MRTLIGVQGRSNSTRFPKKIYEVFAGKSVLQHVYERCVKAALGSRQADGAKVVVLGPSDDEELKKYCDDNKMEWCFPDCPEGDLISRYRLASQGYDRIVRITADCPLVDPGLIILAIMLLDDCDYATNTIVRTYPDGLDVQACRSPFLEWVDAHQKENREHPFLDYDFNLKTRGQENWRYKNILNPNCPSQLKISVDTKEDLERIKQAYEVIERVGREKQAGTSPGTHGDQQ